MKSLDRYIFREVLIPAVVALVALTFMLVARELGVLLELIVRGSASPAEIRTLAGALIPGAMTFTIPLALLVGVLSAFGRFSADSESVAFRATGVSTWQILRPVLLLAVLAWASNLALNVWVAPRTAARLSDLANAMTLMRQLPFELEPRVFNEDVGGMVIYVRDMSPDRREWSGVLLADVSNRGQLNVTSAKSGRLASNPAGTRYEITLKDGSTEVVPFNPDDSYSSSGFQSTTIPVPLPQITTPTRVTTPQQIPTETLRDRMRLGEASIAEAVEYHRRFALPFACIAFALIGLPLGMSTRRGGRSVGLVLSAVLALAYYTIFIGGTGTGSSEALLSPLVGTWAANVIFTLLGIILLARAGSVTGNGFPETLRDRLSAIARPFRKHSRVRQSQPRRFALTRHSKWFRTLDIYVIRGFLFFFLIVALAFASLIIIVTLFELLPDIVENNAGIGLVLAYFSFYTPQIVYFVTPLAILVAVFITLGSLTRSNETLAVRAGAISLYRLAWPLIAIAIMMSAGAYLLGDYLLPYTNQRQDAYRDTIKGRAPQTYLDPLRKWMVGSDDQIYFYNYFDPDQNAFVDLAVLEFEPANWSLERITFASHARQVDGRWNFESGWSRSLRNPDREPFEAFAELRFDRPMDDPDYFKREVRIASQMNYPELRHHIQELQSAGFEVGALSVDLYTKLSFPVVSLIMAMLAIPVAFATGKRGAFYGIGVAIVIGICYWGAFELFGKLGGMSQVSPLIAAWFPNAIFGLGGVWMMLKVRT